MKSTGVVRKIDQLGRLVIPMELRKTLGIKESDSMGIYTEGDQIVLKKYKPPCIFCNEFRNVIIYKGKNICTDCLDEIRKGI